jgi:hypothetical protein
MTTADFLNKELIEVNATVALAANALSWVPISDDHNALQAH